MIGMKEMAMLTAGRNKAKKYKKNFSMFAEHDFFVRVFLVDATTGLFAEALEFVVNADNWMDYLMNHILDLDIGNYKIDKIEFSASGK